MSGHTFFRFEQLALVELLEQACLDLPLQKIGGRHHEVVAGLAGEQLHLQRVVGIEGVVAQLDAGLLAEGCQHGRIDIIRPVEHIQHALLLRGGRQPGNANENKGGRDEAGRPPQDEL